MKTLSLLVCLLGLSVSAFAQYGYQLQQKTLMELAVQHFNKGHAKALDTQSEEFKFMQTLMEKLGEKFPAQKNAVIRSLRMKSFTSLDMTEFTSIKEPKPELHEFLYKVEDLITGCPVREVKTIQTDDSSLTSAPRVRTIVEKTFSLNERTPYNETMKVCTNFLVKELRKLDAREIVVVSSKSSYGTNHTVELKYGYQMQDMGFKLNELKSVSEFAFLGEKLSNKTKPIIGGGNTLYLNGSTGTASFSDPVTITFVKAWGDCPAGCINHEYTTIEATPKNTPSLDFDFKVIPAKTLQ